MGGHPGERGDRRDLVLVPVVPGVGQGAEHADRPPADVDRDAHGPARPQAGGDPGQPRPAPVGAERPAAHHPVTGDGGQDRALAAFELGGLDGAGRDAGHRDRGRTALVAEQGEHGRPRRRDGEGGGGELLQRPGQVDGLSLAGTGQGTQAAVQRITVHGHAC
jgi:hypothetical protein